MSVTFVEQLFSDIRNSPTCSLMGLVEMSRLNADKRAELIQAFVNRSWPLLSQPQFQNIQTVGPWLFGSEAGTSLTAQHDFYIKLSRYGDDAICGWITTELSPSALAMHLAGANIAVGPDGHDYLLRYHTETALPALHARQSLPAMNWLFAPIVSWWIPAPHALRKAWQCFKGQGQTHSGVAPSFALDTETWAAIAGDPLAYYLLNQLTKTLSSTRQANDCYGTRLGIVEEWLKKARELGLQRLEDLSDYVTLLAHHEPSLCDNPSWHAAIDEARNDGRTLAHALRARLTDARSRRTT